MVVIIIIINVFVLIKSPNMLRVLSPVNLPSFLDYCGDQRDPDFSPMAWKLHLRQGIWAYPSQIRTQINELADEAHLKHGPDVRLDSLRGPGVIAF